MISVLQAKKIGINACINKIGRDICEKYADSATSSYGQDGDIVNCFVGVDTQPFNPEDVNELVLSDEKGWTYSAGCSVDLNSGEVSFI